MTSESFILSIDQGTTSCRSIIYDRDGFEVSKSQRETKQHFPNPGWVEQDPEEIFTHQQWVMQEAMTNANIAPNQIAAIGITNQRETTVIWNRKTGKPIYNAIVWSDRRTSEFCSSLCQEGHASTIRQKTGLVLDPYFSATKICWILDHVDGSRELAENGDLLFGTIDTWLTWKFTSGKVHVTDVSNASRTMLMNLDSCQWDEDLLQLFDIPAKMLPEIRSSSEIFGIADVAACPHAPISGIIGDQQAALFGLNCIQKGSIKCTYGTGCFLMMNTGSQPVKDSDSLLATVAWKLDGVTTYSIEGAIFSGGSVIEWLQEEMRIVESAHECNLLAGSVPNSKGLILIPAFTGLGAPHWDPDSRGMILGISRGISRSHYCRAGLEAIAHQVQEVITTMEFVTGIHIEDLWADGGVSQSNTMLQIQSDLLQKNVIRPYSVERTAIGAAFMAGLAIGFWQKPEDTASTLSDRVRFTPEIKESAAEALNLRWSKAIEVAKSWKPDAPNPT